MQSVETSAFEKNQTLGTPMQWRIGIALAITLIALSAYFFRSAIGLRGQSVAGVIFFFGLVAVFSQNLRVVNWHTIIWGFSLQMILAVLVLKVEFVYTIISAVGGVVKSSSGSRMLGLSLYLATLQMHDLQQSGAPGLNYLNPITCSNSHSLLFPLFYSFLLFLHCFITSESCRSVSGYWQGSWST